MKEEAVISGATEALYSRHPKAGTTTESLLVNAFNDVLDNAGIERSDVDGLGVASFTLGPDHAIDLAFKLGVRLRFLMQDSNGGASGLNLLQHAARAVEAGDASTIVLLAGDRILNREFIALTDNYNKITRDYLAPIPADGPNSVFAHLTQRHMAKHGLTRQDYGRLAVAQRSFAAGNPGAVYRQPLTMEEYLAAPVVAEPLGRFDCVPVVSGADAIVVTNRSRAPHGVRLRASRALHNPDNQEGDGLVTGLAEIADELWDTAGLGPGDLDLACIYDDYPAMVYIQLADLGCVPDNDVKRFAHDRLGEQPWPINTSGGQLSAGQAGAAGGMHGIVEAVKQLRGEGGARQVPRARTALVTGYGMVLYRYGACANSVVLEGGT